MNFNIVNNNSLAPTVATSYHVSSPSSKSRSSKVRRGECAMNLSPNTSMKLHLFSPTKKNNSKNLAFPIAPMKKNTCKLDIAPASRTKLKLPDLERISETLASFSADSSSPTSAKEICPTTAQEDVEMERAPQSPSSSSSSSSFSSSNFRSELEAEYMLADIRRARADQAARQVRLSKDIADQLQSVVLHQIGGGCKEDVDQFTKNANRLKYERDLVYSAIHILDMHILSMESDLEDARRRSIHLHGRDHGGKSSAVDCSDHEMWALELKDQLRNY